MTHMSIPNKMPNPRCLNLKATFAWAPSAGTNDIDKNLLILAAVSATCEQLAAIIHGCPPSQQLVCLQQWSPQVMLAGQTATGGWLGGQPQIAAASCSQVAERAAEICRSLPLSFAVALVSRVKVAYIRQILPAYSLMRFWSLAPNQEHQILISWMVVMWLCTYIFNITTLHFVSFRSYKMNKQCQFVVPFGQIFHIYM